MKDQSGFVDEGYGDVLGDLQGELRRQFLLGNSIDQARNALLRLRHVSSIREYVRAFSALMLEIHDMSEADQLYFFLRHLQGWAAQHEVWCQSPGDWKEAATMAKALVDLRASRPGPSQSTTPLWRA